jgi:nucleoid-associated protein YgaU
MDRGVKIAIFVASIAALCLGLIWDQVLSHARVMVEAQSDDVLAAERMDANIGSPDIERAEPPAEETAPWDRTPPAETTVVAPVETSASRPQEWLEHELKSGESANRLAYRVYRDRGLTTEDILQANPSCKWRVGDKVRIPPGKTGGAPAAPQSTPAETPPSTGRSPLEYEVQEGDSWWRIWEKHKDRAAKWEDIEAANPGVRLRAGAKIKIP